MSLNVLLNVILGRLSKNYDLSQEIMDDKRSQFSVMNDIVNDENGHNIMNDSFTYKLDGLLAMYVVQI